jgi:hypothetical protein
MNRGIDHDVRMGHGVRALAVHCDATLRFDPKNSSTVGTVYPDRVATFNELQDGDRDLDTCHAAPSRRAAYSTQALHVTRGGEKRRKSTKGMGADVLLHNRNAAHRTFQ